jgi:hypothetical protein
MGANEGPHRGLSYLLSALLFECCTSKDGLDQPVVYEHCFFISTLCRAGRCDVDWELGINPWDIQAGILFVREAGGTVTDFFGEVSRDAFSGRMILATNGLLHDQAVTAMKLGSEAPLPFECEAP